MKIIKISAVWCPECVIMRPRWEEIRKEFKDLEIEEVDYDKDLEKRKEYGIDHVPTIIFFNGGKELSRFKGLLETEEIRSEIKKYL